MLAADCVYKFYGTKIQNSFVGLRKIRHSNEYSNEYSRRI